MSCGVSLYFFFRCIDDSKEYVLQVLSINDQAPLHFVTSRSLEPEVEDPIASCCSSLFSDLESSSHWNPPSHSSAIYNHQVFFSSNGRCYFNPCCAEQAEPAVPTSASLREQLSTSVKGLSSFLPDELNLQSIRNTTVRLIVHTGGGDYNEPRSDSLVGRHTSGDEFERSSPHQSLREVCPCFHGLPPGAVYLGRIMAGLICDCEERKEEFLRILKGHHKRPEKLQNKLDRIAASLEEDTEVSLSRSSSSINRALTSPRVASSLLPVESTESIVGDLTSLREVASSLSPGIRGTGSTIEKDHVAETGIPSPGDSSASSSFDYSRATVSQLVALFSDSSRKAGSQTTQLGSETLTRVQATRIPKVASPIPSSTIPNRVGEELQRQLQGRREKIARQEVEATRNSPQKKSGNIREFPERHSP